MLQKRQPTQVTREGYLNFSKASSLLISSMVYLVLNLIRPGVQIFCEIAEGEVGEIDAKCANEELATVVTHPIITNPNNQ